MREILLEEWKDLVMDAAMSEMDGMVEAAPQDLVVMRARKGDRGLLGHEGHRDPHGFAGPEQTRRKRWSRWTTWGLRESAESAKSEGIAGAKGPPSAIVWYLTIAY